MQAVVFHGIGDIRLEDVAEPKIKDDTDAIVRITASAICGTDLHFVRGTVPGLKKGTILGHEPWALWKRSGRASAICALEIASSFHPPWRAGTARTAALGT